MSEAETTSENSGEPGKAPVLEYQAPAAENLSKRWTILAAASLGTFFLAAMAMCYGERLFNRGTVGSVALAFMVISPICAIIAAIQAHVEARKAGLSDSTPTRLILLSSLALAMILGAVFLFSSTGRAGESANRIKCTGNLIQIGQAISQYTSDHPGQWPASFGDLLADGLPASLLVCPSSNDMSAQGATTQQVTQDFRANAGRCSYTYVGARLGSNRAPDYVLAYEPPKNHMNKGGHVLFADGHGEWLNVVELKYVLSELAAGHNPPRVQNPGQTQPSTRP